MGCTLHAVVQGKNVIHPGVLDIAIEEKILSVEDLAAVELLAGMKGVRGKRISPERVLLLALAVRSTRDGHTCVSLDNLTSRLPERLMEKSLRLPRGAPGWIRLLSGASDLVELTPPDCKVRAVPPDAPLKPFVLDKHRLYTTRAWFAEEFVARELLSMVVPGGANRLQIILGGPGVGKTYTIANTLIERLSNPDSSDLRVALVAPTGKAAKRMGEAILGEVSSRNVPDNVRERLEGLTPETVHAFLGMRPGSDSARERYLSGEKLEVDLVIVDEVSMMSMALLTRLLEAIPAQTELILVGDPDQLASVDAGSVLGDIDLSSRMSTQHLFCTTKRLVKQRRFGADSPIAALVGAVKSGDEGSFFKVLESELARPADERTLNWIDPDDEIGRAAILKLAVDNARAVQSLVIESKSHLESEQRELLARAYAENLKVQVLCALRHGPAGVAGWNRLVGERVMGGRKQWCDGRPIMVVRNDRGVNLFNGDVGVVIDGDRPSAVFSSDLTEPLRSVARIPEFETVYALTIHKSQGSEYSHPVVVLPTESIPLVTRELLYTAVSRARDHLTILASAEVLRAALGQTINRATGLADRLLT